MREAMDNPLAGSFIRQRGGNQSGGGMIGVPLNVREEEGEYIITALVPGVEPGNVAISLPGNTLRISEERRGNAERQSESGRWLAREPRYGAYSRPVTLPGSLQTARAGAGCKDGALTVTLPKAEEARERRIPVRAAGQTGDAAREIDDQTGARDGVQPPARDEADREAAGAIP